MTIFLKSQKENFGDLKEGLFEGIFEAFSRPRLLAYLNHLDCSDRLSILSTYYWNIQLSQSLYPTLEALEIVLRNALHRALSELFKTKNWFDFGFLHPKEQAVINQCKRSLIKQKKQIEPDRMIAELRFGFWTSLFDLRYEHRQILWPKLLPLVFRHIPKSFKTRHYLSKQLNYVRHLRNRVFHYEPIWYWHNLAEQHENIINLLKWLSPAAYEYILSLDHFQSFYKQDSEERGGLLIKQKP